MKKFAPFVALPFVLFYTACQGSGSRKPLEKPGDILKNFTAFWQYYNTYVRLSDDFIALDDCLHVINKEKFLKQLVTGSFLPLRLSSQDSAYYQLLKIDASIKADIPATIKQMADFEYKNYQLEGKPLTGFNHTGLTGSLYNRETTKDKIVVLKRWFIKCGKCEEERPAFNKLAERYKNNTDVIFASLAIDSKEDLQTYLSKTKIDYAIIPVQEQYMENDLGIAVYPTYIIIN